MLIGTQQIIPYKQIQNMNHLLNNLWAIRKTLKTLKGFSNQSKGPPGTMDKQRIEKLV